MYCTYLTPNVNVTQVGGKAANLGKALSLGLRVPSAFVVTKDTLTFFLAATGLKERVVQLLKYDGTVDRIARQRLYKEVSAEVLAVQAPEALKREVSGLGEKLLGTAPTGLAVRSSGIQEDSEKASFAGIYSSFLCISSIEALWESIKRCWCSSFSPQIIDYSRKMDIDPQIDQMAVIVQEMVQADSSGVIFTADPLTGNPWRFVLNSTFGLAQDLVAGKAAADQFILEWDIGKILEKSIAEKKASLSDECVHQIGDLARRIDRALDSRVDIEWAIQGEEIFVIQARPITALPEFFPHKLSGADSSITWVRSNWNCSFVEVEDGNGIVAPLFRDVWSSEQWLRYKPDGVILGHSELEERDFDWYRYSTKHTFRQCSLDFGQLELWLNEHEIEIRNTWLMSKQNLLEASSNAGKMQENTCSVNELIPILLSMRDCVTDFEAITYGPSQSMVWNCEELLENFIKEIAPDFDTDRLLQGSQYNSYSYERTAAAQDLGRGIHESFVEDAFGDQPLDNIITYLLEFHRDCSFLEDYEQFCWQFGIRPLSWLCRTARWSERNINDQNQILLAIRSAFLGQGRDIRAATEKSINRRKIAEAEIRDIIRSEKPSLIARFDRMLDWVQFWGPVLDDRSWYYTGDIRLWELIWQIGTILQKEGLLDVPEDLLLFTAEELECMGSADNVIKYLPLYIERKREYERNRRLTPLDHLGAVPEERRIEKAKADDSRDQIPEMEADMFMGSGYAPGNAIGIARKASDLKDPKLLNSLSAENVLVCLPGSIDFDTDWASLLMVVSGLVTMRGCAILHHATQLAREFGVAYVHLPDADANSIPDNSKLSLNGLGGKVTIL